MKNRLFLTGLLLTVIAPMQFQAIPGQKLSKADQNLLKAIEMGNMQLIKRTIDLGANVNAGEGVVNPLIKAISNKSLEAVKFLVSRGANVNKSDSRTEVTPLMWAIMVGAFDIVHYLISQGANINSKDSSGATPLMWAALTGQKDIMAYLESLPGINIDAKDNDGKTAQDLLEEFNKEREVNALSENQ